MKRFFLLITAIVAVGQCYVASQNLDTDSIDNAATKIRKTDTISNDTIIAAAIGHFSDGYTCVILARPTVSFPGGNDKLYEFIKKTMYYPEDAIKEGVQGRVVVQFIVHADGSLTDIKVVRGRHPSLDKEALRIVQSMPKWEMKDCGINGFNTVTYNIPITFRLP